ncbi:redoxin domain-containing protein [Akkermansiaceae bacterium]|jgi:peroxiredoxin|nr:redoxin domain-containing protein [Akkermansiaceae bacterium]
MNFSKTLSRRIASPLFSLALVLFGPALAQELSIDVQAANNDSIRIDLHGQPTQDHVLEYSPDAQNWEPLLSLNLPSSPFQWNDPLAPNRGAGFYRLLQWPGGAPREEAADFRLIDHEGRTQQLHYHSFQKAIVLFFTDPDTDPSLGATLKALKNSFGAQAVEFWVIDPISENRSELVATADTWQTDVPILHDSAQLVSRAYNVDRGTEVVVIDTASWTIFYRGAIERPAVDESPAQPYLSDALTAFFSGQPSTYRHTPATGDPLPLGPTELVSYEDVIAPMMIESCVRCHSPNNIAPFSFDSYESVAVWAHDIREVTLTGEMPPWFADPEFGSYEDDWSLSKESLRALVDWIDQGALKDGGTDPLADFVANTPPPSEYPFNWPSELGEPDMILTIPSQNIPANGEVDYRYIELDPNIPANTYLRAAIVKPGNPEVVHHGLAFIGSTFEAFIQGAGLNGYFASYVPGVQAKPFPPNAGKLLKANPTLTLQMHYQTNGSPQTDATQLGLYFHSTPPEMEYRTTAASTIAIDIVPNVRDYEREASVVLSATEPTLLYELSPHMHFRGSRMEYDAIYPNGEIEKLLSVPYYIFDWQLLYRLAEPKWLPAGTSIRVRGAFDNSPQNSENPDPTQSVSFGEQSDEEMFIGYINFAVQR